jgi:hypothetical protein
MCPMFLQPAVFSKAAFSKSMLMSSRGGAIPFQYRANTMEDYERYRANFAPAMQKDVTDKYAGKFVAFRTILEEV